MLVFPIQRIYKEIYTLTPRYKMGLTRFSNIYFINKSKALSVLKPPGRPLLITKFYRNTAESLPARSFQEKIEIIPDENNLCFSVQKKK